MNTFDLITLRGVVDAAKAVGRRYRELTGKPLGVTAEVGEVQAAELLGLKLAEARQAGYDAVGEDGRRVQIKAREGFATLTADQSHHVLRPIAEALPNTSEKAVSPSLLELRDGARHVLDEAAEIANERLDQILSESQEAPVRKVPLRLRNREIKSQDELEAARPRARPGS